MERRTLALIAAPNPCQLSVPFSPLNLNPQLGGISGSSKHSRQPSKSANQRSEEPMEIWTLKTGKTVLIRPIRPEDEPLMVAFHQSLSEESVYLRYAHLVKLSHRISHDRLSRICHIDTDKEIVLVAEHHQPTTHTPEIVAVGRLNTLPGGKDAEFALLVSDAFQHQGLGAKLLNRLIQIAQLEKRQRVFGEILPENDRMEHLCQKLGFQLHHDLEEGVIIAEIQLPNSPT